MRAKERRVFEEAVSLGAIRGVRRAYKHNESPPEELIAAEVERCIIDEVDERFTFEDERG